MVDYLHLIANWIITDGNQDIFEKRGLLNTADILMCNIFISKPFYMHILQKVLSWGIFKLFISTVGIFSYCHITVARTVIISEAANFPFYLNSRMLSLIKIIIFTICFSFAVGFYKPVL